MLEFRSLLILLILLTLLIVEKLNSFVFEGMMGGLGILEW